MIAVDVFPRVLTKIVEQNPDIHKLGSFEVKATEDIIQLDGLAMSDFIILRGDTDG